MALILFVFPLVDIKVVENSVENVDNSHYLPAAARKTSKKLFTALLYETDYVNCVLRDD